MYNSFISLHYLICKTLGKVSKITENRNKKVGEKHNKIFELSKI